MILTRGQVDNTRMVNRYFPPEDTLTRDEYRRLTLTGPAPIPIAVDERARPCAACSRLFVPHPLVRRPRFCSKPCRRWYHEGAGAKERKALAS